MGESLLGEAGRASKRSGRGLATGGEGQVRIVTGLPLAGVLDSRWSIELTGVEVADLGLPRGFPENLHIR